jgi:hypothetical protein
LIARIGSFDILNLNYGYPEWEFKISTFTIFYIQNSLLNVNSAGRNFFQVSKIALLDVQNSDFWYLEFEFLLSRIGISDNQNDGGISDIQNSNSGFEKLEFPIFNFGYQTFEFWI